MSPEAWKVHMAILAVPCTLCHRPPQRECIVYRGENRKALAGRPHRDRVYDALAVALEASS